MLKKTLIIISLCWGFPHVLKAQVSNTGALIFVDKGGVFYINQNYKHTSGKVLDNGKITVTGDWTNNDATSGVFDSRSTGSVELTGAAQTIAGSSKTSFPGLKLSGTGAKTLAVNMEVAGVLELTDRELKAEQFSVSILNTKTDAVLRSSGFISTDKKGKLLRATNSAGPYLFPLGSAANASLLYRPLVFEPQASSANTFAASFIKEDPTNSGYSVNSKRQDVQNVFNKFFYIIDQTAGSSNTGIKFFQNTSVDGEFKQLANWSNFQLWEKAAPSTLADGSFGDGLNRSLTFASTKVIRNTPFTFANASEVGDPLTIYNAFSPDGDGKNDKWVIHNLDLFPNNDLTIFNRWGDEVYKTQSYSTDKAWDGANLNAGTYFYVLNVNIAGTQKSYKGFITLLKKN